MQFYQINVTQASFVGGDLSGGLAPSGGFAAARLSGGPVSAGGFVPAGPAGFPGAFPGTGLSGLDGFADGLPGAGFPGAGLDALALGGLDPFAAVQSAAIQQQTMQMQLLLTQLLGLLLGLLLGRGGLAGGFGGLGGPGGGPGGGQDGLGGLAGGGGGGGGGSAVGGGRGASGGGGGGMVDGGGDGSASAAGNVDPSTVNDKTSTSGLSAHARAGLEVAHRFGLPLVSGKRNGGGGSDHDHGDAIDVGTLPIGAASSNGATPQMKAFAEHMRQEGKAGRLNVKYIISDGRIASATNNWEWRPYTYPGKSQAELEQLKRTNPGEYNRLQHFDHVHVSFN